MKKILLIFLIPVLSFTQSGDTNGDGFVNLEDLFNVLENWLEEVNANDTESISNIEEMINVVDSLITINQNFDISRNTYFPEGLSSQIINHNFSQGEYVVPEGKRLYILNVQCDGGLFIDNLEIMYNVQSGQSNTLGLPIIINANQTINIIEASGSFNGFLVDESSNLEGVTIIVEPNTYTVPDNKILFINHYYAGSLSIDNNAVWGLNYLSGSDFTFRLPTMIGAGQEVSCVTFGNDDTDCVINGYLVSEDYFSSVSNNNSSNSSSSINNITNNSTEVSETEPISFNMGFDDFNYTVPENKNLVITSCFVAENWTNGMEIILNGNLIFQGNQNLLMHQPLHTSAGDNISGKGSFNGYLIPLQYSTIHLDLNGESYTVPEGKRLILTHKYGTGYYYSNGNTYAGAFLLVDDSFLLYGFEYPIESPLYFNSGQTLTGTINISGYLIDE